MTHRFWATSARALKPGGEAWLIVPALAEGERGRSCSTSSPRERERRFGQWDHVRQYGRDFADRIRRGRPGRSICIDTSGIPAEMVQHMALGDTLFRARRTA